MESRTSATVARPASRLLKLVVALLAILVGPSVVFAACRDYPVSAFTLCRNGLVIDPETKMPFPCTSGPFGSIDCIKCLKTWCNDNTFWCKHTCVTYGGTICDAMGGCDRPIIQALIDALELKREGGPE